MAFVTTISSRGLEFPQFSVFDGTFPKCGRNAEIRARHEKGESMATLAEVSGIRDALTFSPFRTSQINGLETQYRIVLFPIRMIWKTH